VTEGRKAQ
jgi:hypothetical protein